MSDIRTRIADALAKAIGTVPFSPAGVDEFERKAAEAGVEALLSLPGIAIVELPAETI